jgi:predicted NACHT family NTPase
MGLQATAAGIEQAKVALKGMQLNQEKLATRLGVTRQPIGKFFRGEIVGDENFVRICEVLDLDWKMIAGVVGPQTPNSGGFENSADGSAPPELGAGGLPGIDTLVQQTRSAIEPLIREQCGMMRVLDMDQPIELTGENGIYTNVNILEKLTRLRHEKDLLEDCDFEVFDRFSLGRQIKRLPGLAAVEQHRRLMVLGKPGAGKTTFLKYLAMQCITGGFAADRVPFFVTLKDFAEAEKSPSLVAYLAKDLTVETVGRLLSSGYALVFLDGLDEVREEDTERVNREMRETAAKFGDSQFVITCRIAAKEYTFVNFTEVEVADFDEQQIATFVANWFRAKHDLPKAKTFVERLEANEPIQELASSPLLLTLLCLVFGEGNDFPSNRADLYGEGVKILLKKWDAKRNIQRDELYKKLDVQRREHLLSYLALQTFQQKEYFIKQRRLEGYIADFIGNLRDVDPEPEALRIDSEVVLKSIQAQHGLLVERARGIYSFSHLTFQEYFTAREIAATNQVDFLVSRIGEKRWREVFLLTVGMIRDADKLLLSMKWHIDLRLSQDEKNQHLLQWVNQKSSSVQVPYKPAAMRVFYFALARGITFDSVLFSEFDCDVALALDLDRDLAFDRTFALDRDLARALERARARASNLGLDLARTLALALERNLARAEDPKLRLHLQMIRDRRPDTSWKNQENLAKWWQTNGKQWTEDLRQIMITHRNIGHDWQFTDTQKALLQQYHDANRLLVECLNSDCYVSRSVREEIEATLLLPMAEIEKRKEKKEEGMEK